MSDDIFQTPYGATALDPDEKEGLKIKHVMTKEQLNQIEQANIEEGVIWLTRHRAKDILTDKFIKQLHKKLFGEVWTWAGNFRRSDKNIGVDWLHIPIELKNLLDDVRYWTDNETYQPIEAAIRFHHRLVQIHLFPNGNGRHARIMADEYLERFFKISPLTWKVSSNSHQSRKQYIKALQEADRYNYEPLLKLINHDET